jgi:autotransporter-associated beta strand protein
MKAISGPSPIIRLLAAVLALTGTATAAPGDILFSSEFNTDGDFEGWVDNADKMKAFGWNGSTITGEESVVGGVFRAKVTQGTNSDAQLVRTPFSPTIDANVAGSIQIRIRQSPDDGATWKTAGALDGFLIRLNPGNFNPDASLVQTPDETVAGDGWTILTYNIDNYVHQALNNFRFDPSATSDESLEIDYIRILETDNPRPLVEVNPASAIPAGFDLVRQWDDATELTELVLTNYTSSSIGDSSLGGPAKSLFAIDSTSTDPYISTPNFLEIGVGASDSLIVEIAFIPTTGSPMDSEAQLFWDDASGGFAAVRRLGFPTTGLAEGVRHVLRATFVNDIDTQLDQLRFDPHVTTPSGRDFELDYIRVYRNTAMVEGPGLEWDTDTITAGAQGGTGTWNTADLFWLDDADSNVAWPSPPVGDDDNAIFGATAGTVTIDAGGVTAHNLSFETTGYEITGGDLTLDDAFSTSTISVLENVSATISSAIVADDANVRKTNPGSLILANDATMNSFTVSGGNVTISPGTTLITLASNPEEDGFGLKLSGSSTVFNINGSVIVDEGSFGGFAFEPGFEVNLNSAGTLSTAGTVYFGWNAPATYNFNGGTSSIGGNFIHLDGGSGTASFVDGTHEIAGRLGAQSNGKDAHSVITIDGGSVSAGSVGYTAGTTEAAPLGTNSLTLNLNGGSLETNRIFLNRGPATNAGDNTFNLVLNGGTIIASADGDSPTLIDGNLGNALLGTVAFNITVEENGVTFDTNGTNKSIDQPLLLGTTSGGSVTKTGEGNLYINEANAFDGGTFVTQGNLGGRGFIDNDLTVSAGAGLAYFITDPNLPTDPLAVGGTVSVPDPLVISIDSGDGVFTESPAAGIVMLSASEILGFNPATVQFDLTSFTGTGTWSVAESNGELILEYTLGTSGYSTWAGTNAGGQSPDLDFDNDGVPNGVEYFMGETGSTFTPNPGIVEDSITWPKDPDFAGTYKIQISDDLADWADIVPPDASINESDPNEVVFTIPSGGPKNFVRLVVEATP